LPLLCAGVAEGADPQKIAYTGDGSDLQAVIDAAPVGATITCDAKRSLEISKSITIRQALTLTGLHARLPEKLGRTPILIVAAEGVTLSDLELHGNYDSVTQRERLPCDRDHLQRVVSIGLAPGLRSLTRHFVEIRAFLRRSPGRNPSTWLASHPSLLYSPCKAPKAISYQLSVN
jgi:hypothetical protein